MSKEIAIQEAGITIEEQIGQALKKMPYTEATIAELKSKYMDLKTNGVNDKAAYNAVHAALMITVKVRTSIETSRKLLKEDALKFGRAVDIEAKKLTGLVEPLENYLYEQRDIVDKEKERIQAEKDAQEQATLQGRVAKLLGFDMLFDGNIYKRREIIIVALNLKRLSDEDFEIVLKRVEEDYLAEQSEIVEEARLKKEEENRLAAERIEQDRLRAEENMRLTAERERLEKIAEAQADKEAAIKAAQDKLDAEKKAIEDQKMEEEKEKRKQEELEKARQEAAEQAKKDEQARVERETKEKEEKERLAALEAEEKKAQMTDREKMKELYDAIDRLYIPEFKSKKAKTMALRVGQLLQEVCEFIEDGLK